MKFLVAFLFAAFVAHIRADAMDEYLMDEDEAEPDRHPYVVSPLCNLLPSPNHKEKMYKLGSGNW